MTESAWLTEPVDGIARVVGTTVAEQLTVDAVPSTITRYNVNQSRGGLLIQMSRRSVVLRVQSNLGTTRYNVNQPWGLLIQTSDVAWYYTLQRPSAMRAIDTDVVA